MPRSTQYAAVSRSPRRTSGFTLRGKPSRAGQHRQLAAEVLGLPAQHVAEQHGGLVVEVVAGGDDVVAAVERGLVEQVALRQPARRARHALGGLGAGRDVEAVVVGQVDLDAASGRASSAKARAYVAGLVAVVADAEAEVEAVGLVAERRAGCPTRRASPCRPTPRRAPARPARSCRSRRSPWRTWSRQCCRKCSAQKLALWRRMSMTAGSRHTRHFTPQPPEMTGRISTSVVVGEQRVARHERVAADHEHRLAVELEAVEQRVHADRARAPRARAGGCGAAPSPDHDDR